MPISEQATMGLQSYQRQTINSYKRQAGWLLKEYVLADSFIPYTAIITGIFFCKMVYDLTQVMSAIYFKNYSSLSKMQRIEWNNRAMSTSHAIFVTIISLYFVFLSDLYSDNEFDGLVILRSSLLSTFALGVRTFKKLESHHKYDRIISGTDCVNLFSQMINLCVCILWLVIQSLRGMLLLQHLSRKMNEIVILETELMCDVVPLCLEHKALWYSVVHVNLFRSY